MKEHPILFSDEMVRAILADKKTQTRRPVAPQPVLLPESVMNFEKWTWTAKGRTHEWGTKVSSPFLSQTLVDDAPWSTGDRLWVRETWRVRALMGAEPVTPEQVSIVYRATEGRGLGLVRYPWNSQPIPRDCMNRWIPAIHMPRWASRLTLEVTNVRVQRLQEITATDCLGEGVGEPGDTRLGVWTQFMSLWNGLYSNRGLGWDTNPWVWAITFQAC